MRTQIVQLMLPWFDPAGSLNYAAMSLSEPGRVDRKKAFRILRRWYKDQIGVTVDKHTLQIIWKRRHSTWALDLSSMEEYVHQMARRTYEETISESNTELQEVTSG